MENKIFLKLLSVLITSLFLFGIAHAGDILFHEEIGRQPIMYRVSPDGTDLRKIGHGLSPKWSPDKRFISYIGADPENIGELVGEDPGGREIFRIEKIRDMGGIIRYSWNPKGKSISPLPLSLADIKVWSQTMISKLNHSRL